MEPRFPARGTPEWRVHIEQAILREDVDDKRQWKLLRQVIGLLSGLDPVQPIVAVGFQGTGVGSGSGTGSGSRASCACGNTISTRTVVLAGWTGACAGYNGTHICSNASSSSECEWIGTMIRIVFQPGAGNWSVYCLSGGRLTNWQGSCAGFAGANTNVGDGICCPVGGTGSTWIHT